MLITQQNEIISLMPTARWDKPERLFGYLEEEESVALEPLLGQTLYQHLLDEYERLTDEYGDITATTIRPTGVAKQDPQLAHADVTDRLEAIQAGTYAPYTYAADGDVEVPKADLATVKLIRICQQIEWYKMLSHKAGLLTVSFNAGGGLNVATADDYESADEKRMERVVKDAYMSAGRAVDALLLFLEADAKGDKQFTEKWREADAFYLHQDLLFTTARELNQFLDIHGERAAYVAMVRDIRFCQNTYLSPRIGGKLLQGLLDYINGKTEEQGSVFDELVILLRTALAFYVEARREDVGGKKMARRDSFTDAQQAMAVACKYIEEHIDELGNAAVGSPIYEAVKAEEARAAAEAANARLAEQRRERQREDAHRRATATVFTGFPMVSRFTTEHKK